MSDIVKFTLLGWQILCMQTLFDRSFIIFLYSIFSAIVEELVVPYHTSLVMVSFLEVTPLTFIQKGDKGKVSILPDSLGCCVILRGPWL